jgi:hypothetical protein
MRARLSVARRGRPGLGTAGLGTAGHGAARRGKARQGTNTNTADTMGMVS